PEQQLKLLERAEKEHGKRLDRWMSMLERRSPRAKELNKRADAGDEDAAAELRVIRKKLAALNMLLMSLPPEERDRLLSEIDGKSVDEMTRLVRFAARNTTRIGPGRERRGGNRPGRGERRPGNRGPDGGRPPRGERGGERPPRGEGPRGPERRDPKGE
ncbi:MAG: hypothetical protein OEY28_12565, partial [Nitrospira sp.]|nr:hypothetical protein [Nitrospira sp.]